MRIVILLVTILVYSQVSAHVGYPDPELTPGVIDITATKEKVCVPGYSKKDRNVSDAVKRAIFVEYQIPPEHRNGKEYEIDHLIPLELGGSNDQRNLGAEPAEPRPGFHEKDKVENYLHQQVCLGVMSLSEAQKEISTNWLNVYDQINH